MRTINYTDAKSVIEFFRVAKQDEKIKEYISKYNDNNQNISLYEMAMKADYYDYVINNAFCKNNIDLFGSNCYFNLETNMITVDNSVRISLSVFHKITANKKLLIERNNYTIVSDSDFFWCCNKCSTFNVNVKPPANNFLICEKCLEKDNTGWNVSKPLSNKVESKKTIVNPYKRFVGIELEVASGKNIPFKNIPKEIFTVIASHSDSSINGNNDDDDEEEDYDYDSGNVNREIVTTPMNADVLVEKIPVICNLLQKYGYEVNNSCGFHVHFDFTKEDEVFTQKLYVVLHHLENAFFSLVPPSRQKNDYCKRMNAPNNIYDVYGLERTVYNDNNIGFINYQKGEKYSRSRYKSFNFHSYFYRGTVENRIHSGTINSTKIINWIMLNLAVIEWTKLQSKKRINELINTMSSIELLKHIIVSEENRKPQLKDFNLVKYCISRNKTFYKDNTNTEWEHIPTTTPISLYSSCDSTISKEEQ